MTDAALTPTPPVPGGGAPPAGGDAPPPALKRPDWLPEQHWDTQANAIKPEFGTHYAEIATFHKTESERQAALKARKPEEIKIALPADFKLPDGIRPEDVQINDKDPRIPLVRALAQKRGWSQEDVHELVALDTQIAIAAHNTRIAQLAEADKSLGENASARRLAVENWVKGRLAAGKFTAEEAAIFHPQESEPAVITALEKIIAEVSGTVPGNQPDRPQSPAAVPLEKKLWPLRQGVA